MHWFGFETSALLWVNWTPRNTTKALGSKPTQGNTESSSVEGLKKRCSDHLPSAGAHRGNVSGLPPEMRLRARKSGCRTQIALKGPLGTWVAHNPRAQDVNHGFGLQPWSTHVLWPLCAHRQNSPSMDSSSSKGLG